MTVLAELQTSDSSVLLREAVVDTAQSCGCTMDQLTTDKSRAGAHRFYRRLGFVVSHEGLKLHL